MTNQLRVSKNKLIEMFLNYKKEVTFSGVTFANITYLVDESKSKTVNKEKMLRKQVTVQIMLGASYQDKVNRIIEKENQDKEKAEKMGSFLSGEMSGKAYVIPDNRFVAKTLKTGEELLCYIIETRVTPRTKYFLNDENLTPIKTEEARTEAYFTPAGLNPKRAEMGGISEENKFFFNTLYFKNIQAITMNKKRYIVED